MKNSNGNYNWLFTHNAIPVIFSLISTAITIALSYASLDRRLALLEQKVDTVIEQQKLLLVKYSEVETRYGILALKIERLETIVSKK